MGTLGLLLRQLNQFLRSLSWLLRWWVSSTNNVDDELVGSQKTRIDKLWALLDNKGTGRIDVKALQAGLRKIDSRASQQCCDTSKLFAPAYESFKNLPDLIEVGSIIDHFDFMTWKSENRCNVWIHNGRSLVTTDSDILDSGYP